MKRVTILAVCLLAGASDTNKGQPLIGYPGSTLDLDDNTAGLLIAAGKARTAPEDAKLKDTTKDHEAALEARAKAVTTPEANMAALIAQAVASAVKALQAPAAPEAAPAKAAG